MTTHQSAAAAFVRAKRAFGPALKVKNNLHLKAKYADLDACLDAVDDALLANGLALLQETSECENGVIVETVFLHESGESIRCGKLHVPAIKADPQGYGSALTYARRYSLMAACGIAPEDDDGNAGSKPGSRSADVAPTQASASQDMRPQARARRIAVGVAAGDAKGAALALSQMDEKTLAKIWEHIDVETQTKLTAAWPVTA